MKLYTENRFEVSIRYEDRAGESFPFDSPAVATEVAKQAASRQEVKILSELQTSGIIRWALERIREKRGLLEQAIKINEDIQEVWYERSDYRPPEGVSVEKIAALLLSTEEEEIPVDMDENKILITQMEGRPVLPSAWKLVEILEAHKK